MQSGAGLLWLRTGRMLQDKTHRVRRVGATIGVWMSLWNLFVNFAEYEIVPSQVRRILWPKANGLLRMCEGQVIIRTCNESTCSPWLSKWKNYPAATA